MTNLYVIYTKKLAFLLRKQGFKIIKTGVNKNYPQYNTYLFEDTTEFQAALHLLTKKN